MSDEGKGWIDSAAEVEWAAVAKGGPEDNESPSS